MNSDLLTKIPSLLPELLCVKQNTLVFQSNFWAKINLSIVFGSCKVKTLKESLVL